MTNKNHNFTITYEIQLKRSFFIFWIIFSFSFAQSQKKYFTDSTLNKNVHENQNLLVKDPEQAFRNTKVLMKRAAEDGDRFSQLLLLDQQCWYYTQVKNLDGLLKTAEEMEKKSKDFENKKFEAVSHIYFSQIYLHNNMLNEANQEFDKATKIAENSDMKDIDKSIFIINSHSYISNIYRKIDLSKTIKYLKIAAIEINNLKPDGRRRQFAYMNFSNMASAYYDYGKSDSAEYYIKRSMAEHPKDYKDDGLMMVNYGVLGDIYRGKKDYEKAKYFYKKAETFVDKNANLPNIREIYNGLYKIYVIQDSADKAEKYRDKLNATELQFEKSKNKFLHTYIQKEAKQKEIIVKIFLILSVILVIAFAVIVINYRRKTKILQEQEKVSEQYFEEIQPNLGEQNLSRLIEMIKDNNPAFLATFLEKLSDFPDRLLSINPSIVQTEIEFCALLKLNIPTKEIAKYYNIEHRSVQNKKYRIRKKLNIPENMDIYLWFNQF